MRLNASPLQYQHCRDDENFTTHAAPSPACGAIEPRYRGFLLRCQSDRDPKMMKISPPMQLQASPTEPSNPDTEALCSDA